MAPFVMPVKGSNVLFVDAHRHEVSVPGMAVPYPLFRHKTPQAPPYPAIQLREHGVCLHNTVILHPAFQVGVELLYHLIHRHSPGPPRYGLDTVFHPPERLGRKLDLQHLSFREAEPQEAALMAGGHGAFLPVHPKFEALFQELLDRIEHPFSGTLRFYIHVTVVRVETAEPMTLFVSAPCPTRRARDY